MGDRVTQGVNKGAEVPYPRVLRGKVPLSGGFGRQSLLMGGFEGGLPPWVGWGATGLLWGVLRGDMHFPLSEECEGQSPSGG